MKKRNLLFIALSLLVILALILILITSCGKDNKVIEDTGAFIQVSELPEHKEYEISAIDYSRLTAADNVIPFGKAEERPTVYIGLYEGIVDSESNYKPDRFCREVYDSYIFENGDYRIETYLVPEEDLSDYMCMTKSAIYDYIERYIDLTEETKSFMKKVADGIKLGNREVSFDEERTSPYIFKNSKIFYEYIETDYDKDGTNEPRYLNSLCSCTNLGNDMYLVARCYKLQHDDVFYDEIANRFVPEKELLELYTEESDMFKDESFKQWIKAKFPNEFYGRLDSAEEQINKFILRIIPSNIDNASEEEIEKSIEKINKYYEEKYSK